MKRRIVLDVDQDMVDYLAGDRVLRRSGRGTHEVDRLLGAARAAVTMPEPDLCPTCGGSGRMP